MTGVNNLLLTKRRNAINKIIIRNRNKKLVISN